MSHQLVRHPEKLNAWEVWKALSADPGRIALESASEGPGTGRWTILVSRPRGRLAWKEEGIVLYAGNKVVRRFPHGDPIAALRETLAWYGGKDAAAAGSALRKQAAKEGIPPPPFLAGMVGWLSYELGRRLLPAKFPSARPDVDPPLEFGLYGAAVLIEGRTGEVFLAGMDNGIGPAEAELSRLHQALDRVSGVRRPEPTAEVDMVTQPLAPGTVPIPAAVLPEPPGRAEHRVAVARIRELIAAGDVYQVNLSSRFSAKCRAPVDRIWKRLRKSSPEPFNACVMGADRSVLSASMERLFSIRGREIETRPIKGTRPRGETPDEDDRARAELEKSEKDRAELLMIVDLHRNDLGKICEAGTVETPTLYGVRTFARVHHLEATVRGRLKEGANATDAIAALFPAGSITGAPKVRAMQVIEEVEPAARGVYCGAIGYMGIDGDADFAVAIRTAVLHKNELRWSAGGGIVWDSEPDAEWKEVLAKGRGFREIADALAPK